MKMREVAERFRHMLKVKTGHLHKSLTEAVDAIVI